MNVTQEVIVDLLPVYLSGEASPATRSLVEEFLKQDAEFAQRVRRQWAESFAKLAPSAPPPEVELIAPPHAPSSRLTEVAVRHRDRFVCHFIQFPILVRGWAHPGTSLFAARRSPCVRQLRGARTRLLCRLLHPSPAPPRHRAVV